MKASQLALAALRASGLTEPAGASGGHNGLPALDDATEWLNSPPWTAASLRGQVVLIDFWTYTCINWLRTLPYIRAWAAKYRDQGLIVIGVHSPEFTFEGRVENVRRAVADLGVDYPVVVDRDHAIWRAFGNQYWPAQYLIGADGQVRDRHDGEGEYARSGMLIQQLLTEAGSADVHSGLVVVDADGAQASADWRDLWSAENYTGAQRTENFASPGGAAVGRRHGYTVPDRLALNQWALSGDWTMTTESAVSHQAGSRIAYRFHARDLHLVMGPVTAGAAVRFRLSIDGAPPDRAHGTDVDARGHGTVDAPRLYQLVRQPAEVTDRLFEIEFADPGVAAFAFTFG